MKYLKIALIFLSLCIFTISCENISKTENYSADHHLTVNEQQQLLWDLVRFYGRLPAKATHETKFSTEFDEDYKITADLHHIDFYFIHPETNAEFLLLSRPARSLYERRVAIGIEINRNENGLAYYHEHFRTWRMAPDELLEKSNILFSRLVQGKSLEEFYPQHSGTEEFIEFPNQDTYFDTESRTWRAVSGSALEELLNNTSKTDRNS